MLPPLEIWGLRVEATSLLRVPSPCLPSWRFSRQGRHKFKQRGNSVESLYAQERRDSQEVIIGDQWSWVFLASDLDAKQKVNKINKVEWARTPTPYTPEMPSSHLAKFISPRTKPSLTTYCSAGISLPLCSWKEGLSPYPQGHLLCVAGSHGMMSATWAVGSGQAGWAMIKHTGCFCSTKDTQVGCSCVSEKLPRFPLCDP